MYNIYKRIENDEDIEYIFNEMMYYVIYSYQYSKNNKIDFDNLCWKQHNGKIIKINDMSIYHLYNTIKFFKENEDTFNSKFKLEDFKHIYKKGKSKSNNTLDDYMSCHID